MSGGNSCYHSTGWADVEDIDLILCIAPRIIHSRERSVAKGSAEHGHGHMGFTSRRAPECEVLRFVVSHEWLLPTKVLLEPFALGPRSSHG